MKRILSAVLSVIMLVSVFSSAWVIPVSAAENPMAGTSYAPLFDSTSQTYKDTFVINPEWSLDSATSETELTFKFSGVTITEKYDASRHFSSYAAALSAWEKRYESGGALKKEIATAVPNYILAAGKYSGNITVRYSANIYGAMAGITPNDPSYDVKTSLPDSEWNANPARTGESDETVISGKIFRSNINGSSASDLKYEQPLKDAGVSAYTLNIDGVKFTGTTAVLSNDLAYTVGMARTSTINVKNSLFDGVSYGLSAESDTSRNFNDYNLSDVRVVNMKSGGFFNKYIHKVNVTALNFEKNAAMLYQGGNGASKNDLWWTSCGGDRGLSFTVTGSRFANNSAAAIGYFLDNCYLLYSNVTFKDNKFFEANTNNWGVFRFDTYQGTGYPRVSATFSGNTFYTKTERNTLFNGNPAYQAAAYDLKFNENRVIGYKSMLPNLTSQQDGTIPGYNWDFSNNYFAPSFGSVNDELGQKPAFMTNTASVSPVNLDATPYYFDYAMTANSAGIEITGCNFEDKTEYLSISNSSKTVTAMISSGTVIDSPEFTVSAESAQAKLWADEQHTVPVTSISYDDISTDGKKIYYLTVSYKSISAEYTVTFIASGAAVSFAEKFNDEKGIIKNSAALYFEDNTKATGSETTALWNGQMYRFTVGVNAFTSVADAVAAGITQLILPSGEYGAIDVTGSIELYGEGYAYNPTAPASSDVLAERARSDEWKTIDAALVGNIVVAASATPADETGTTIVIKGLNLGGKIVDTARTVSAFKTSLLIENCILGFRATGAARIFDLANANAMSTDETVKNIDEFTVRNSRYEFTNNNSSNRLFQEICPSHITLDGVYFGSGFISLGWPKWRACVQDGVMTVTNCYFKEFSRSTRMVVALCGHADQCESSTKNTYAVFTNNVLVDCFNKAYNADSNVALQIFPGAFRQVDISGNIFADTNNYLGKFMDISSSTYSDNVSDYSSVIRFENNSVLGLTPYLIVNSATKTLDAKDGNYYARYSDGYLSGCGNNAMYGALAGGDYSLDFAHSVRVSQMDMVIDRKLSFVNNATREASFVLSENESYIPDIKSSNGRYKFQFYGDEQLNSYVGRITAADVGDGRTYWAAATDPSGARNVYRVYVTAGNLNAQTPDSVGSEKIESPYLYYIKTTEMPVGTLFTMKWQGTDYVFEAGRNAFASISQIIGANEQNKVTDVPNVILPSGIYSDEMVATKDVNIYGESSENTVLKTAPKTSGAVKIACVGDSITEGHGISVADRVTGCYPAQLQTKLNEEYGEGKYEVGNFGWGGSTINVQTNRETNSYTYWTYIYTVQYYKSLDYNPDIVVIMMGHNDTHHQFYTTAEQYKAQYQALIDSYKALPSHPEVVIAGCTTRAASIRRDYLTETIIPMQKELASDNGLIYIDMFTPSDGWEKDSSILGDGLHGTVKGYGMIADLILSGISPLLASERHAAVSGVKTDDTVAPAADNRIKVACIGDSLTYGDKAYKGYPVYLQELLGDGYDVRNYGECGAIACDRSTYTSGTDWCYTSTQRYAASKEWKPDIVIMMLGFNDKGSHLTGSHSVNWKGGATSSAAAEFRKDYTALVKEYMALGAQVYISSTPCHNSAKPKAGTGTLAQYINPIIKEVADELSLPFVDTFEFMRPWKDDMYCGTNTTGVTDDTHLSAKGYETLGTFMFEQVFPSFENDYYDDLGEIRSDALILDIGGSHNDGDIVSYSWENENWQFVWGKNAFSDVNALIDYAVSKGMTDIQVLIGENAVDTNNNNGDINITADTTSIKSLVFFGQNRRFDPNDRSEQSYNPAGDWSRNKDWDMFSKKGGTSAVNRIVVNCNNNNGNIILAGTLKFKGITMRSIVWNQERKAGTAEDPRNLDVIFENCLVDFNAVCASGGYLFNGASPRNNSTNKSFDSKDSLTLKNLRIERYIYKAGMNRLFPTYGHGGNLTMDGVYYNGELNRLNGTLYPLGQFGWIQQATGSKVCNISVINSNFRNDNVTLNVAQIANNAVAAGLTSELEIRNNIYYNVNGAFATFPKYYTKLTIEDNVFVQPDSAKALITNNAQHTDASVDYVKTIGYSAKNNTFVLADLSKLSGITLNSVTIPDLTGCYVAQYTDDYLKATSGTAPASGTADWYWIDFKRTVKNTDLELLSIGAEKYGTATERTGDVITITTTAGQTITDMSVVCKNKNVNSRVFADKALTIPVDCYELKAGSERLTYYIRLSYGSYEKIYTVEFILGKAPEFAEDFVDNNGIVKNTAVALIPSASGKNLNDKLSARWNGGQYQFTYGVNAFASTDEIYDKFGSAEIQVIVPAGDYTSNIVIHGPWQVYGQGYAVNPNELTDNGTRKLSDKWVEAGQTVLKNADIVIGANAAPKTEAGARITVSGFKFTRRIDDSQRTLSQYKTVVTFENNVYDRLYLSGDSREFNFTNENNVSQDDQFVNTDELVIRNMYYNNSHPSTGHAMFAELVAPFVTIDGLWIVGNTPSIGYPKVTKTAKSTSFTLENCYFSGISTGSARFPFVVSFSGHDDKVESDERANFDSQLNIRNNTFENCGNETTGGDTQRFPVQIFPQAYNKINIDGNTVVSSSDGDYKFIDWATIKYIVNSGDYSDRITFVGNRLIGVMPAVYVNSETTVGLSDNYFAKYTANYKNGTNGDIPADTSADYYFDFAMTAKVSDLRPENVSFTADTDTAYAYAVNGENAPLSFTNANGVQYAVFTDKDCTAAAVSAAPQPGTAQKLYIRAKLGNISTVFEYWVMGIKTAEDAAAPAAAESGLNIDDPAIYYSSLYGAPAGIKVISYYGGKAVAFVTGENVVTSHAEMAARSKKNILLDDAVTEFDSEFLSGVSIYSSVGARITGASNRKYKIAAVGDSITQGVGASNEGSESYPAQLQTRLGSTGYEVKNFGKSAATVQIIGGSAERGYKVFANSEYTSSLAYAPDAVIFALGTNDVYATRWDSNSDFVNEYIDLINDYRALDSKPAIYMTTALHRDDNAMMNERVEQNLIALQKYVALKTGAQLIDTYTEMRPYFDGTTKYIKDNLHPNANGYSVMSTYIAKEIKSTLKPYDEGFEFNGVTLGGNLTSNVGKIPLDIRNSVVDLTSGGKCTIDGTKFSLITLDRNTYNNDYEAVSYVDTSKLIDLGGKEFTLTTALLRGQTYDGTVISEDLACYAKASTAVNTRLNVIIAQKDFDAYAVKPTVKETESGYDVTWYGVYKNDIASTMYFNNYIGSGAISASDATDISRLKQQVAAEIAGGSKIADIGETGSDWVVYASQKPLYWMDEYQMFGSGYTMHNQTKNSSKYVLTWIAYIDEDGNRNILFSNIACKTAK